MWRPRQSFSFAIPRRLIAVIYSMGLLEFASFGSLRLGLRFGDFAAIQLIPPRIMERVIYLCVCIILPRLCLF